MIRRAPIVLLTFLPTLGAAVALAGGPSARDPEIVAILGEVSTARIKARIETLAGFGTRHTLSDAKNPT